MWELKRRRTYEYRWDERLKTGWGIYTSRIHWVARGTGTPKDKDEVNKREVCECDGWVCDLETMGIPSILSVILSATALARMFPTLDLSCEEKVARWKWNWPRSDCGSWTPEVVKNRSVSRWVCKNKRCTNSLCKLPDVLTIGGIKEIELEGRLL